MDDPEDKSRRGGIFPGDDSLASMAGWCYAVMYVAVALATSHEVTVDRLLVPGVALVVVGWLLDRYAKRHFIAGPGVAAAAAVSAIAGIVVAVV